MAEEKSRLIPNKNYLIALGILLGSFILVFYTIKWYGIYQEENLNKAIISDYLTEVSFEEFSNYIKENNTFAAYVGIASQDESRSFENIFKNVVSNYDLYDYIIFLNLKDYSEQYPNYIDRLNAAYESEEFKFSTIPALVIFEDEKIKDIEDVNLNKNTAIDLLRKYEVIND